MERLDITPVISKRFPARNPMMVSKKELSSPGL
jgi:hypothetical protein